MHAGRGPDQSARLGIETAEVARRPEGENIRVMLDGLGNTLKQFPPVFRAMPGAVTVNENIRFSPAAAETRQGLEGESFVHNMLAMALLQPALGNDEDQMDAKGYTSEYRNNFGNN
ncbi:hypothetical protein D3C84_975810 [compost metagenome]